MLAVMTGAVHRLLHDLLPGCHNIALLCKNKILNDIYGAGTAIVIIIPRRTFVQTDESKTACPSLG